MKVVTVLGTRPEVIRLGRVIEKLDGLCDHRLVHTGQNFDPPLSDLFFAELGVRRPDHYLGVRGESFGEQAGQILAGVEAVFRAEEPDAVLVLGDTNSGLCSIVAKRLGVPVYHMEAGNAATTTGSRRRSTGASSTTAAQCSCRTRAAARRTSFAKASRRSASMSPAIRSSRCSLTTRTRSRPLTCSIVSPSSETATSS